MARAQRHRLLQAAFDIAAWYAAYASVAILRAEFDASRVAWGTTLLLASVAALLQILVGTAVRLYRGRFAYGSFEEVLGVTQTVAVTTLVVECLVLVVPGLVSPSRPIVAGVFAVTFMLGLRYSIRLVNEFVRHPSDTALPVVVFGAGEAGRQLIRSIQHDASSRFRVVAILDDDKSLQRLEIAGIRVAGKRDALARVVEETGAARLIIALPNADAALMRELDGQATALGLRTMVLPALAELPDGVVSVFSLRDISEEDLLGRRAIHTDLTEIGQLLYGKRVLITGAGGSIGSELARQVHKFEPAALGLLDRDENGLHSTQLSIYHRALLDDENTILASIRDPQRIREVFEAFRPDIVFHAAALKHLPLLEKFPGEAAKTNVFGTLHVLEAAQAAGVGVFVNISTDKAADPISVLGFSKRITERLTAAVGHESEGTYVSVRFGNVLGSHGSVLHSFAAQIADGGPVTVTHPDVTRYFMTIPEAVQLVLQAAAVGEDGEVLVLDMGEPVRIADVAEYLIAQAGQDIGILFTGLRAGEKLEEDLLGSGECDVRPRHELISQVAVSPLWPSMLDRLDHCSHEHEMRAGLRDLSAVRVPDRASPPVEAPGPRRASESIG
jgi:FlaA1/EpsC-like NDP-sugar epimerase